MLESGAMLVALYVCTFNDQSVGHRMAELAAVRDTFTKRSPDEWERACAYREGMLALFDEHADQHFAVFAKAVDGCSIKDIIDYGRKSIAITKRKVREVRAKNQFHSLTVSNVRVIVTTRLDLVSDEFKDDCDLFIAHAQLVENGKPCTVFGLRSSNGSFRCDVLAKSFGGGGHPKAAGFKIHGMFFDESQWNTIVNRIQEMAT
jgi:oligoribonuclease NrnB/cAMP/cGMP phosphodiesterase (DHH superfamily)